MWDTDVIVVGFRCAGAPLAYALHEAGVKVIAVDRDPLFSNQPISTHAIQPYGMKMLDRLGLGDTVRALAPPNTAFRFQVEDQHMQMELRGTDFDSRSPRRAKLDPALQRAALDAGVDARESSTVTDLLRDGERVTGVRVKNGDATYDLRAPLVVGADGRNSAIARMVGAPTYLESTTPNALYWSYFEETPLFSEDPRYDWGACIHIEGEEARAVFLTDSGLLLMAGAGRRTAIEKWRGDPATHLQAHLRRGSLTAPLLEGSKMIDKPLGVLSLHFFMKQGVGPGWALVGDSGLHMDPTPGMGITDAFRDALALSEAIVEGGDKAMAVYWRRRDSDSIGLYHFAGDMGSAEFNNPLTRMMFRRARNSPKSMRQMSEMMDRQIRPIEMFPPATVLAWMAAEAFSGNFSPWSDFARMGRFASMVRRQQRIFDRALARAQAGDLGADLPRL